MFKRFIVIASGILVFGLAAASRTNAGTDIVADYGGGAPAYNYAPPPPPPPAPVYYAPPAVGVVVYPTYGYYHRTHFFGHRRYDRRHIRHHRHWR